MSRFKGNSNFNRYRKPKTNIGEKSLEVLQNIQESNPTIKMFLEFRQELDDKHDRYENVVKHGRDITIESKRIIFLLHNTNTNLDTDHMNSILEEAKARLDKLILLNFKSIALLLNGHDAHLYHRAYTSALQEFIEAVVFYQFLKFDNLESWSSINESFLYQNDDFQSFDLLFPQNDYILGIADFTGELMRRCINNLGVGNVNDCFKICNFVKYLYTGYLGLISPGNKELGRKVYVLKQSLAKMELVCYNIQIRGSEVPKHMLASVIESANDVNNEEDEGYY